MDNLVLNFFQFVVAALLSCITCFLLVPELSKQAIRFGLVDKPTDRKQHSGEVPIIGGMAIFLSTLLAVLLVSPSYWVLMPLAVGSVLVLMGVLDDKFNLSAIIRLPIQIVVALLLIYLGHVGIESVGNLMGAGPVIMTGAVSIVFTVMCTVGVINSINMIDGVDGLSGVIISITILPLIYFCLKSGDTESVVLLVSLLASVLVFLYFNARIFRQKAVIFMGDAGSMLFGLLLVWYFIRLTQGDSHILSPIAAGWIFGLPLVDTISVMVARVLQKRSPFDADRNHFHHQLLDSGFSVNQTVLIMAVLHAAFVLTGVVCNEFTNLEPVLFWLFTLIVIMHHFFTPVALKNITTTCQLRSR